MTGRAGGRRTGRGGEAEPRPMQRPVQRPVVVKRLFLKLIFNATSPNQVPIQRDSNKHQLEPDMSDLSQTLKFFQSILP
jgi:hypothetical protein